MTIANATSAARAASVPPATRIYAIGDIHGRADLLADLVERIDEDLYRRPIEHAGRSLSRRLHRSRQRLEGRDRHSLSPPRASECDLPARKPRSACWRSFCRIRRPFTTGSASARLSTLTSYGVAISSSAQLVPAELHRAFCDVFPRTHLLFLQCLRNLYACGDYLFVHAGIRPGVPLRAPGAGRSDLDSRRVPSLEGRSRMDGGARTHARSASADPAATASTSTPARFSVEH